MHMVMNDYTHDGHDEQQIEQIKQIEPQMNPIRSKDPKDPLPPGPAAGAPGAPGVAARAGIQELAHELVQWRREQRKQPARQAALRCDHIFLQSEGVLKRVEAIKCNSLSLSDLIL